MANITVNGQSVSVSDAFMNLPQSEQNRVVDQIAASLGARQESQPNALQRFGDWATAGITGSRTEPSIPRSAASANLRLPAEKAAQLTALFATTASDDRLKSGILRVIPEAQFETDQHGNLVAIVPVTGNSQDVNQWTRFYPNPSGLGLPDVMQASGALALGGATGLLAKGLLGAGAAATTAAGAGMGATEAGLIEAASSSLSGDQFNPLDIPLGAAGGAIGAKLAQAIPALLRSARLGGAASVLDASGNFTPAAIRQLESAGINPSEIGPDVARRISEAITRNVDPGQAVAMGQASTLPVPVALTQGQATRNVAQQLLETEAAKGVYGETPRNLMQSAFQRQQQQLAQNIPAIQSIIAGDASLIARNEGAAGAQATLAASREAQRRAASEMFTQARQSGSAAIQGVAAGDAADALLDSVRSFAPEARPNTTAILDKITEELAASGDVKRLFDLRSQLVNAAPFGTPDQAAASAVKSRLDEVLMNAADNALLRGDSNVVRMYADAIKNYAGFASQWKSGGILDRLTRTQPRDGAMVLSVAPEDAANYIFGRSANGMITKTNLIRDLSTLQRNLPEDQWNALRQEAFLKIFDASQRSGVGDVTGTSFSRLWNDFKRQNPALVRQLFNESEQSLFSQFAAVATRVSTTARNTSNSASALAGIVPLITKALGGSVFGRMALAAPALGAVLRGVKTAQIMGSQTAREIPRIGAAFAAGAGAGGAVAATPSAQSVFGIRQQ